MWSRDEFLERTAGGLIGMVHLRALPGSPGYAGELAEVTAAALADAAALDAAGIGAVMIENYNDVPFYPERVPAETVAAMTAIISALAAEFPGLALGVNVLRNDAASALAVAVACGADFIRVNVHTGAAVTDQGPITGEAWHTLRLRRRLGADRIGILADVRVKHARPLVARPLTEEAADLRLRGQADGVIVTGVATGGAADPSDIRELRAALPDCPLLVGSGLTAETLAGFRPEADGVIIGSWLKTMAADNGWPVVSVDKARHFCRVWQNSQSRQNPKGS
ncbi:phosphorybosylanthranilate isomerase [bacterium DOLJORAL78_65_58]|nr:MAG: phosphorybosylanthranilate isomerase [bacterium DOLZORAL124_64_63]PIE76736.1 MAG: phosphorybosylanthranilate isomerase [bacterium DOLJORAL78_65_58]